MARTFLRGIAIAAGTGLAFGRFPVKRRSAQPASAGLEPLAERLDRIEARLVLVESRPAAPPSGDPPADLAALHASIVRIDQRLAAQAREIELLRIRAEEAEKIAAAEIRLTERRFTEVAAALPSEIEALVAPRVEDLRLRLHMELKQSVGVALAGFEQSLDTRISSRMSVLELQLADLSASLADLKNRSGHTDTNLQKLIQAVECLCDCRDTDLIRQTAVGESPAPAFPELPFEKHMKQALADTPAAIVAISEAGNYRARLIHQPVAETVGEP